MSTTVAVVLLVLGMGAIGAKVIAVTLSVPAALAMSAGANESVTLAVTRGMILLGTVAATIALAHWWVDASWLGSAVAGASLVPTVGFSRPPRREPWEDDL